MKLEKLNQWMWRWHVIAGLVSLPFVLVLAITGGIYLFKSNIETPIIKSLQGIKVEGKAISFQKQLKIVSRKMPKVPTAIVLPSEKTQATEFVVGKFSHKNSWFVNPYTGNVNGNFSPEDSWMHIVRKLHGELLGGEIGTKIVELIASWMIVLILTGIYIFWPARKRGWRGFFSIRIKLGRRIMFRDIHAIGGVWISGLLLLTLAGGLPWTDVFGGNFKKLQEITNTGFSKKWFGMGVKSNFEGKELSLDEIISISKKQKLSGKITIDLPKQGQGVFSISNETMPLREMKKLHFDAYSGKQLMELGWSDIGVLMRARLWVMAFHQGQMGQWNFILMLIVSLALTFISLAGFLSFRGRSWGIPSAPDNFKVGVGVVVCISLLAILLPLFGVSLLLIALGIFLFEKLNQ